jgi:hypothetical protein
MPGVKKPRRGKKKGPRQYYSGFQNYVDMPLVNRIATASANSDLATLRTQYALRIPMATNTALRGVNLGVKTGKTKRKPKR